MPNPSGVYAEGERVPIRLVQENGGFIELDATSIDMVVERIQSNFALPALDARKFGIDMNQAAVIFEVQGVFTDEPGQEATSGASAIIDFHQTQNPLMPKGSSYPTSPNTGGQRSKEEERKGTYTFLDDGEDEEEAEQVLAFLLQRVRTSQVLWDDWHGKYIELPVAYWLEQDDDSLPSTDSYAKFWFSADKLDSDSAAPDGGYAHGGTVSSFDDMSIYGSSNTWTANSAPKYYKHGAGGKPYVWFDGTDDYFSEPFESRYNPNELTIFTVAHTEIDNGATQTIFASRESSDGGYLVGHNLTGANNRATSWIYNDGADTTIAGDTDSVTTTEPIIVCTTYTPNAVNLYVNGKKATEVTGTDIYEEAVSGTAYLGAWGSSHEFSGRIYEVIMYEGVLDTDDRTLVEGYLGKKYNIQLTDEGNVSSISHPYTAPNERYRWYEQTLKVYFDTQRAASKREPYGYMNWDRSTGLTVDSGATPTSTSCRLSGNIKDWADTTQSDRPYRIKFKQSNGVYRTSWLTLTSVDSGGTNIEWSSHFDSITPSVGDVLYLSGDARLGLGLCLPLKNAGNDPLTNGPTYPNYGDGTTRFANTALASLNTTRTDEYIAHTLAQLLGADNTETGVLINNGSGYSATHTGSMTVDGVNATLHFYVGDRVLDEAGRDLGIVTAVTSTTITIGGGLAYDVSDNAKLYSNKSVKWFHSAGFNDNGDKTMDKAFSTSVSTSADNSNSRLTITQVHKNDFGRLSKGYNLNSNLPPDKTPLIIGFTGGKSGKSVKSAGDKVQDILGILANSQNYAEQWKTYHARRHDTFTEMTVDFADIVKSVTNSTIYAGADQLGDYIYAIQIPYNSLVTLGKNLLDSDVAQRNFFLTVGHTHTQNKLAMVNTTHASGRYTPWISHGSERNGIHGMVTDFNVKRDAAMKAYEFSLKFVAADIII